MPIFENYLEKEIDQLDAEEGEQSGAYVPGTDRINVESDYNGTQTLVAGAALAHTTMTFGAPEIDGTSFVLGTKGIHVVAGSVIGGFLSLDVASNVSGAAATLWLSLEESLTDGGVSVRSWDLPRIYIPVGQAPYLNVPIPVLAVTPGSWLTVAAAVVGANVVLDSFGGMNLLRLA